MKKTLVLLGLLLALIPVAVQAQTPSPRWPPDPARIFAEGVLWAVVEDDVAHETDASPPAVTRDNEARVVRVYHASDDTWTEYPYPDDITQVLSVRLLPDGMLWLQLHDEYEYGYWQPLTPGDVLLLNPDNGLYSELPAICAGNLLQVPADVGEWVIVYDDASFVCHTHSGEVLDVLPEGPHDWVVDPSPDGTQLVLIGSGYLEDGHKGFQVWAYTLATGQRTALGTIPDGYLDGWAGVCDWFSDTQGLLCTGDRYRGWPGSSVYAFDVAQPDSVTRLAHGWPGSTMEIRDRPRLFALSSYEYSVHMFGAYPPEHFPCTLTIHDLEWSVTQEVGYECLPLAAGIDTYTLYYEQGSAIYFLTTDSEDAAVSHLNFFDTNSPVPDIHRLFTSEIESILSVSPDGRYIVLRLGTDGVIDVRQLLALGGPGNDFLLQPLLVWDSQRSDPVYLAHMALPETVWLDDRTLVINTGFGQDPIPVGDDSLLFGVVPAIHRITFSEDRNYEAATITYDGFARRRPEVLSRAPNQRYWLLRDSSILDLTTFVTTPLLRDGVRESYDIRIAWNDDSTLRAFVSMPDHAEQQVVYQLTF